MKKSFVLIAVIAALFAAMLLPGCDNGTEDNNAGGDNTGNNMGGATITWNGSWHRISDTRYQSNTIGNSENTIERLGIQATGAGTVTIQITASSESGSDYGYASKLDTGVSTSDYQMRVSGTGVATYTYTIPAGSHWIQFMYQKDNNNGYSVSDSVTVEIIAFSFADAGTGTTLKISNQSFTELTDVIWQNENFANSQYENSIKTGTNVSKSVTVGGGYIYFKRKSNAITARTRDMVTVNEGETIDFTFTDNTLIVEANNPDNAGTLSALQSTVVFWDDAEGALQPYTEAASFVGYYATYSDLNSNFSSSYYYYFNPPKNGKKSIAVGETITAKLHLRISLTKTAKLSFWYANKRNSSSSGNTTFSINGTVQRTWSTDVNWSKLEFDLAAGVNDLVWEKKDGSYSSYYYYLTLDDILIYYTE